MGHIYRELKPIFFADNDEFYVDTASQRVYVIGKADPQKKNSTRITIGYIVPNESNLMYVNVNFKKLYPELWEKYYGKTTKIQYVLNIGVYLVLLAIAHSTGVYSTLIKVFGVNFANVILDMCLYVITFRDNVMNLVSDRLENNVLFSHQTYSSGWISNFLSNDISENKIEEFKALWIASKLSGKEVKVALGIDGSNTDCNATSCDLAEKGKAKSKNNSNIVAYMWIIDVATGDPITYFVSHGSVSDCKLFFQVFEYLKLYNVQIDSVLLDRIFCNSIILEALSELSIPFYAMVPSDTFCHVNMMKKYRHDIDKNPNNLINEGTLYGVSEKTQIFKKSSLEAQVSFYYNDVNGAERRESFTKKLFKEYQRITKLLNDRKEQGNKKVNEDITVKSEFKDYIIIDKETNTASYNIDKYNEELDSKGCFSIAAGCNSDADATYQKHSLRNVCEEVYRTMKSQLGNDTLRGHSTEVILSRFFICFIATILRNELFKVAKKLKCDVNTLISKMNRIRALNINGSYKIIHDLSDFQKKVLKELGLDENFLLQMEKVLNGWDNGRAPKGYQHPDPTVINIQNIKKRGRKKSNIVYPNDESSQTRSEIDSCASDESISHLPTQCCEEITTNENDKVEPEKHSTVEESTHLCESNLLSQSIINNNTAEPEKHSIVEESTHLCESNLHSQSIINNNTTEQEKHSTMKESTLSEYN